MKTIRPFLTLFAVGVIAVAGSVWAQQVIQNKKTATQKQIAQQHTAHPDPMPKTSARKLSPSPNKIKIGSLGIEADPQALAAYRVATHPIALLEERTYLLMHQGDWQGAEHACLEAIAARAARSEPVEAAFDRNWLGEIYLREGQYQKCIEAYLPNYKYTRDAGMNLNVALAYTRLGNADMARKYYSEEATLKYVSDDLKEEYRQSMPGTEDLRSLEASILFAIARKGEMYGERRQAVADYQASLKLVPQNGLIAYRCAEALEDMNRPAEAEPYFQRAVQYGRGKFVEESATHLKNIAAWRWRKTHP